MEYATVVRYLVKSHKPRRDWAPILERRLAGESLSNIAKTIGLTPSGVSWGLKRYTRKLMRERSVCPTCGK